MYTITHQSNERVYGLRSFVVDTETEVATIPAADPTIVVGSTVFVIATSNTYMLNHQRQWVLITQSSGSDAPNPDTNNTYIWDGGNIG